jgi:hypothetical protein
MKAKRTSSTNAVTPPLGLDVPSSLSLGEWQDIGRQMAMAIRSAAFVIGDWLVYGEGRGGQMTLFPDMPEADRVSRRLYVEAVRLTGCDMTTLQHYAHVARRVPRSMRNEHVSWEHHRKVAKLRDDDEKRRWLVLAAGKLLAGHPLSLRIFARSIQAGRLMSADELDAERSDTGIENVHPYVNRIVAFFARLRDSGWLANADEHKRAALKRDLQPIIDIYTSL